MDPQTFNQTLKSKIDEYALDLPPGQREDFAQDMWVLLLALGPTVPRENKTALAGFLSITLFRSRENWTARQRARARGQDRFEVASAGLDEPSPTPDVQLEAEEALRDLVESLKTSGLSEDEIGTVVDGLRDGLTQKEIALSLGRTPQGLNYHLKKFRPAA